MTNQNIRFHFIFLWNQIKSNILRKFYFQCARHLHRLQRAIVTFKLFSCACCAFTWALKNLQQSYCVKQLLMCGWNGIPYIYNIMWRKGQRTSAWVTPTPIIRWKRRQNGIRRDISSRIRSELRSLSLKQNSKCEETVPLKMARAFEIVIVPSVLYRVRICLSSVLKKKRKEKKKESCFNHRSCGLNAVARVQWHVIRSS